MVSNTSYTQDLSNLPMVVDSIDNSSQNTSLVSTKIESSLLEAVQSNNINLVKEILTINPKDINSRDAQNRTALMLNTDDSLEIVKLLINHGAFINTKDYKGNTALMIASEKGYTKLVALLLTEYVQVNAKNNEGLSALHLATINGYTEIVELLIKNRADINDPMPNRLLPIFEAVTKGYTSIVKLYLDKGANVNSTISSTRTSLLAIASALGNSSTVQLLLEKGANPNLANKFGVTPIFLSISKKHLDITKLLITYHADLNVQTTKGIRLEDIISPTDITMKRLIKNNS